MMCVMLHLRFLRITWYLSFNYFEHLTTERQYSMIRQLALAFTITLLGCLTTLADPKPNVVATKLTTQLGEELINRQNQKKPTVDALKGKIVGIYFSAHWCPPCRSFTPQLVNFYKHIQRQYPDKFEIVFVSFDRTSADMREYMKATKMPWLAIPYDAKHRLAQPKTYNVSGIPTLIILDEKGEILSRNAYNIVKSKDYKSFKNWIK